MLLDLMQRIVNQSPSLDSQTAHGSTLERTGPGIFTDVLNEYVDHTSVHQILPCQSITGKEWDSESHVTGNDTCYGPRLLPRISFATHWLHKQLELTIHDSNDNGIILDVEHLSPAIYVRHRGLGSWKKKSFIRFLVPPFLRRKIYMIYLVTLRSHSIFSELSLAAYLVNVNPLAPFDEFVVPKGADADHESSATDSNSMSSQLTLFGTYGHERGIMGASSWISVPTLDLYRSL